MTNGLSPTAKALADASAALDRATQRAYDAQGTTDEDAADAAYARACDRYEAARQAHRAARIANGDNI